MSIERAFEDDPASVASHQPNQIWKAVLGELQLQVTRPSYETWLRDTTGISFADGEFVVGTPNAFVAEMLEQRMYSLISQVLERITTDKVDVRFQVLATTEATTPVETEGQASSDVGDKPGSATRRGGASTTPYRQMSPNPKYTFDTFIVGKSNELAHAAAQAVSERPGQVYNPLVLYSDVGLGKTHLLHAIGHRILAQGLSLIYATTEEFTNEYIKAIREGKTEDFRQRYRNADVLLLDDIQFLIGKEQTQEGFFHTFNALHMNNKQIVITSDRPVSALSLLDDRVRSRLAGGLVADIQPPDLETRLAILNAKAQFLGLPVPKQVIEYLGERIHKNIRELEGCLNRVVAYAQLTRRRLDTDLVKQVITEAIQRFRTNQLTEDAVLDAVAEQFGVSKESLLGPKRDKKTALARQVAMYILREDADMGATAIARVLGRKDHTTALHGCKNIEKLLNLDARLRRDVLTVREALLTT
ncbi:MAG: chromosomal replication initiator protein DnaA [Chloroflexi bacterium]|nr:chromosomal replication initiator protein DnaA [Chloroflexota bacterium]